MKNHVYYMTKVLELAKKGWGKTNPNPLVGAMIVKDGKIISKGYHKKIGGHHAEIEALKSAKGDVKGATLYVNLEPCSHFGRTPPCAKAIIDAKIKNVVIAMVDPNPKVSGKGIQMLKDAGIDVEIDVLEKEAKELNQIFIKYITRKRPYVIMKTAMTLDGKIATVSGDSKWITNQYSRQKVHIMRDRVCAVMVGINTIISDNPWLTTRIEGKEEKHSIIIVVDSKGIIPLESNVLKEKSKDKVILATTSKIDGIKEKMLINKGVKILKLDCQNTNHVDLEKLMDELYKFEIDSILLEGGGTLNAAMLELGLVDRVMMFIAPKIIGGKNAKTPVEGEGIKLISNCINLKNITITRYQEDILVEGNL